MTQKSQYPINQNQQRIINYKFKTWLTYYTREIQIQFFLMKGAQKPTKNSYNLPQPPKLRAQIIRSKIPPHPLPQSSQSSQQNSSSDYDSEVQQFANEFYDDNVKQADKILQKTNITPSTQNLNQQNGKKHQNQTNIVKSFTQHDNLSRRLNQLKKSMDNLDMDVILFKKKDQNKLKEIAQFLSQKHKEKKDFMKKLKKIKNSQKEKIKIEEEMQKQKKKQEHSRKMKQIRNLSLLIKQKTEKKKQEQSEKLQDIEAFYNRFHKKYKKKKLYKLMQFCELKKKNEETEKQKNYLKRRKNIVSQIVSLEDISEFQKRRQELKKSIQKVKQTEKFQKESQIAQKNKEMRERIYLSNKYLEIQEQEAKRSKMKQIPKEKLQKIKQYGSYIKENFMPSNTNSSEDQEDDEKQNEDEQKVIEVNSKLFKRLKKDRYLNGNKIGQKIEMIPIPKTERQMRMIGRVYLEQLKLLPKKRHATSLDLIRKSQEKVKPITSIPKVERKRGKITLSKNPSRQEIQSLIGSLKAKDESISRKQHYLQMVNHGPTAKSPQRQALDEDLLDNIEKKLNLLSKL